ncbi:hypothetical protein [Natrinema versiforme]|nr:hypothetical protein [Natrinema versiforme]
MTVSYCPVCDDRTVHVPVRPTGGVGVRERCYEHTDIDEQIDAGEYELAH